MAKKKQDKIKEINIEGKKIKVSEKLSNKIDELKKAGYKMKINNSKTHEDKEAIKVMQCVSGMLPGKSRPKIKYCIWAVNKQE